MSPNDRRARARRKAWGRGPMILRFDPLEGRQLLSTLTPEAPASGAVPGAAEILAAPVLATDPAPGDLASTTVVNLSATATSNTDPVAIPFSAGEDPAASGPAAGGGEATTTSVTPTTPTTTPPVAPADRPDLVPVAFGTKSNLAWGERFTAQGAVRNEGNTATPAGVKVDVYASTSPQLAPGAVYVGSATIDQPIAPGGTAEFTGSMIAPPIAFTASPNYYFTLKVDGDGVVAETDEANNGGGGVAPTAAVQVVPERTAELAATSFAAVPLLNGTLRWGRTLQVEATIANGASGVTAPPTRARIVAYAKGGSPDGTGAVTVGELFAPALPGGATTTLRGTIYLPLQTPGALAGQSAITFTIVPDADYLTRPAMSATTLRGEGVDSATLAIQPAASPPSTPATPPAATKADVKVTRVQPASDALVWGKTFDVRATVENAGPADAAGQRVRFLLVDANRPNAEPLALADAVIPPLKAGFQQEIVQTIDLAGALPNGLRPEQIAGRILVIADAENNADEANEGNNRLMSGAVSLKLLTKETDAIPTRPGTVVTTTPGAPTPATGGTATPTPTPTPTTPTRPTTPAPTTPAAQRRPLRPAVVRPDGGQQAVPGNLAARRAAMRALQLKLRTAQNQLRVFRGAMRRPNV
jgi:hypothetical protein